MSSVFRVTEGEPTSPTMLLRFSLLALCLACADPASAQITLRADDTIPYQLGANTVTQYDSPNENGASTATVEALIAQSGPNQTWDFSTLASETFVGTAIVTDGDTGPGADADPYSQATQTYQLLLPPETDEDGNTIEGTVHGYYRIDSDGLHNLGIVITSTLQGESFAFAFARLPGGSLDAPSSYTFGSTWESTFVESGDFLGDTNKRLTYEVDGWGTLVAPGGVSAPALRLKVTDIDLDSGSQRVSYEFRTAGLIAATVDPSELGLNPTASLSVVRPGSATSSADAPDDGYALGAPWPNPARATVALEVTVPQSETARVMVYDLLGREAVALSLQNVSAGTSALEVDASALPAGVYVVLVQAGGRSFARSLTVVR